MKRRSAQIEGTWEPFHGKTTVGTIQVLRGLDATPLPRQCDLYVYLPPSYKDRNRTYPVLYMHDGQNLFDAALSFAGEWGVDEVMERLAPQGTEAIIVGITNKAEARMDEYSSFVDPHLGGGKGDEYLQFLVERAKPLVDRSFRTAPARDQTGLMGSSMGGLISLYGFLTHGETFGFAGVMSPAVRFANEALLHWLPQAPYVPGRLYVDFGTRELGHEWHDRLLFHYFSRRYLTRVRVLVRLLQAKGYVTGRDLLYVEEPGGRHQEEAWARRLPRALRFLLPQRTQSP